jgi:hypothetical protein
MEAGDHRERMIAIRKFKKPIPPGSSAFGISRHADGVGISEWQSESVKLSVADVSRDISYIDFQK